MRGPILIEGADLEIDEEARRADALKEKVPIPVVSYKNLQFESRAYRDQGQTEKKLFHYDQSLVRLRHDGFARHARSAEVFSLLCGGLEGKLTPKEKTIADDMLASYGEWISLALERTGNRLIAYVDPEGLVWEENQYVKSSQFRSAEQHEFDITGKNSKKLIDIDLFDAEVVQFLYGRSFDDLPAAMRKGDHQARLYLPYDNTIWPVCRGIIDYNYYAVGSFDTQRSSRGVAVIGTP